MTEHNLKEWGNLEITQNSHTSRKKGWRKPYQGKTTQSFFPWAVVLNNNSILNESQFCTLDSTTLLLDPLRSVTIVCVCVCVCVCVFSGEELECNLKDLRPATDYHVR